MADISNFKTISTYDRDILDRKTVSSLHAILLSMQEKLKSDVFYKALDTFGAHRNAENPHEDHLGVVTKDDLYELLYIKYVSAFSTSATREEFFSLLDDPETFLNICAQFMSNLPSHTLETATTTLTKLGSPLWVASSVIHAYDKGLYPLDDLRNTTLLLSGSTDTLTQLSSSWTLNTSSGAFLYLNLKESSIQIVTDRDDIEYPTPQKQWILLIKVTPVSITLFCKTDLTTFATITLETLPRVVTSHMLLQPMISKTRHYGIKNLYVYPSVLPDDQLRTILRSIETQQRSF